LLILETLTFLSVSCDIITPETILFMAVINKNVVKSENMRENINEAYNTIEIERQVLELYWFIRRLEINHPPMYKYVKMKNK
jgi:hypothetical protein